MMELLYKDLEMILKTKCVWFAQIFFVDSFESFWSFLVKSTVFLIYQSKKVSRGFAQIFGAIKNDTQKLRFFISL